VSSAKQSAERPRTNGRAALKREQILDAAARVVARRGYAATTLSEIAEEVGSAGAGSLYYHFDSRDDLIEELLRRGVAVAFEESRRAVARLPAAASPLGKLEAAIRAHLRAVLVESDYARASGRAAPQVPPEMWTRINREFRRYGKFYDQLIGAAMAAGELDPSVDRSALRMLVIGAINWAPEWYRDSGTSTPDEVADLLVRMMVRGVGGPFTKRRRGAPSIGR
jgi:TetR/AcrR family transcriptional regulator, cholesterol catabolism regulator